MPRYIVSNKPLRVSATEVVDVGEEIDVTGWKWQTVARYVANGHLDKVPDEPTEKPVEAKRTTRSAAHGK